MLRRDPYIPFFSTCCTPKQPQKEEATPFQQTSLNKQQKEIKFSLKQLRNKSNQSTLSIFERNSSIPIKGLNGPIDAHFKSRQLFNSRQFEPKSKFQNNHENKKTSVAKSALKKTMKKKFDSNNTQISIKQNKFLEDFQLYKTTQVNSPKGKVLNKFGNNNLSEPQQLKVPIKKNFISTLMTSKNNVISINNIEYEPVNQKFEQSMVMIDYFNPPTQKINEIQQYLQKQ